MIKSLKNNFSDISAKASTSIDNQLANSIDIVDKTSEKINDRINNAKESSKDRISNKLSNINSIKSIGSMLKTNQQNKF
jgi:hypothetical protein